MEGAWLWTLDCRVRRITLSVGLSDYGHRTVTYRTVIFFAIELEDIEYRIGEFKKLRTIGYRIKASIYWTTRYGTQKNLSVATSGNIEEPTAVYYIQ